MPRAVPQGETDPAATLLKYFRALHSRLGPQRWWPARTRLEVILGAILTQNTAWRNAARGIAGLRKAGWLNLGKLQQASARELEAAIRPAGFYRQKAATIRNFLDWLEVTCDGSLAQFFARPPDEMRRSLLRVKGLGPETVDAILLYAGRQPFFVADAYARRILARHNWVPPTADYAAVQAFFHRHLPAEAALYNEFHALLVEAGKRYCRRSSPDCLACPLEPFLPARFRTEAMGRSAWRGASHDAQVRVQSGRAPAAAIRSS